LAPLWAGGEQINWQLSNQVPIHGSFVQMYK
jgi:hypothetical protein